MSDDETIVWNAIMDDERIDSIGVRMKDGKTQLKWRYGNGPYFYRWFNFTK